MAKVRMRSTRRLRTWIIEQVSSGKYPGVVWDDEDKTMFRIPWKHAGKQDFRKDEDAAIFKAWAEFKGKLTDVGQDNPAAWKTRLRCALNKSPEFKEVLERAQLDISEPYKVYRLVPICEQGLVTPEKKSKEKSGRKSKRRRSCESLSDDSSSNSGSAKQIKREEVTSPLEVEVAVEELRHSTVHSQSGEIAHISNIQMDAVDEFQLDVRIEESVAAPAGGQDSFIVAVQYLGQEVARRRIIGSDVRILYQPCSAVRPAPAAVSNRFPRVPLPEPPPSLPAAGQQQQALSTLLPYMEKGVVLTATQHGVYGKRFCQGPVFWTGPHTPPGAPASRLERNTKPVLLFSRDAFKQQLELFRSSGGEPPQCSFTLCFGEELSPAEDLSTKLITAKISLPWAEEEVCSAHSIFQSLSVLQTLARQNPQDQIILTLVPADL